MKTIKTFLLFTSGLFMCVVILTRCNSNPPAPNAETAAAPAEDPVERGKYLVMMGGCDDCHSPKVFNEKGEPNPDPTKLLSGRPENSPLPEYNQAMVAPGKFVMATQDLTAWFGPWGISFPMNLTPDSVTGLGGWSEETFIKTLRSGKHMGAEAGRPIMPPMPWMHMAKMKDQDLKDIYAYLRSLKPISNRVPEYMSPPEAMAKK